MLPSVLHMFSICLFLKQSDQKMHSSWQQSLEDIYPQPSIISSNKFITLPPLTFLSTLSRLTPILPPNHTSSQIYSISLLLPINILIKTIIYQYILFRKMSRNSAERSRYKKYDYKTHHSFFSQRSESHLRTDPPSVTRKPSPFKLKKDNTENSFLMPEMTGFDDIRLPLGEIFENSAKVAKALIDPRKDGRNLRNRNAELELKVSKQAKEMEELRIALEGMKELVGTQRAREGQEAREANLSLQARCEVQDREMAALKREVESLKLMAESEGAAGYVNSQLEQSNISRRAQYRQNYEEVASNIPQNTCQHCTLFSQESQQLRILYESQVRRGKADQQTLLVQEAKILELKDQVEHKNKCIDYLRAQLEQYEQYERLPIQIKTGSTTSQDLRSKRQTPRPAYVMSKQDQPFNSFSEFRY